VGVFVEDDDDDKTGRGGLAFAMNIVHGDGGGYRGALAGFEGIKIAMMMQTTKWTTREQCERVWGFCG